MTSNRTPATPGSPASPSSPSSPDDAATDDLSIFRTDDAASPTLPYPTTPLGVDGPPADAAPGSPADAGEPASGTAPASATAPAEGTAPAYGYGGPAGPNRPATAPGTVPPMPGVPAAAYGEAQPGQGAWAPAPLGSPRVRWAGIVWGLLFAAFGVAVMAIVSTDSSRYAFATWAGTLGPWGAGLVALIALGALLLVCGVLGAISRAQRPR